MIGRGGAAVGDRSAKQGRLDSYHRKCQPRIFMGGIIQRLKAVIEVEPVLRVDG